VSQYTVLIQKVGRYTNILLLAVRFSVRSSVVGALGFCIAKRLNGFRSGKPRGSRVAVEKAIFLLVVLFHHAAGEGHLVSLRLTMPPGRTMAA